MPAQVYEHALDLTAERVETVPFRLEDGPPSSPWPPLRRTRNSETTTLPVVVLENHLVRLKIAPTLGGRLVEWHDKRTRLDILPKFHGVTLRSGGLRGVECRQGAEITLTQSGRYDRLGTVDFQLREPDDEASPAAVFVHTLDVPSGLGWTACFTLYPDSASLTVDLKVFNRTLDVVPALPGLDLWVGYFLRPLPDHSNAYYDPDRDCGFQIECLDGWVESSLTSPELVQVTCFTSAAGLGPRRIEEFKLRLIPYSGLKSCVAISPLAGAGLTETELRIQVPKSINKGKTFLKTLDGQTFESTADLYPEHLSISDLSGLPSPALGILIRTFDKQIALDHDPSVTNLAPKKPDRRALKPFSDSVLEAWRETLSQDQQNQPADFVPFVRLAGLESVAYQRLAIQSIRNQDWKRADALLEKALSTNGEDVLAWWLKSAVRRHGNFGQTPTSQDVESEEADNLELLQAHYLAPLEPLLRAEAFLATPPSEFTEGSPLTKPLADDPQAALECCVVLAESGLFDDLHRLIDDLLRHQEIPALRDLLAYVYLTRSRMDAEAAEQSLRAAQSPLAPPFPWRPFEKLALSTLTTKFPDNERYRVLGKLFPSLGFDAAES